LFKEGCASGCDDPELLRRFVEARDEAAFEVLIRRHGPLVIDVCRSVLPNAADVEDAFQTTFLLLARKAGSIRKAASLASWLHGAAYRTSCRARTGIGRRARHEGGLPLRQLPHRSDDLAWREVRQILHEEMDALLDRYRIPLLLCYLEGLTQDKAAASLRIARSTFKVRLERGRELLRDRLVRRGLGPSALVVATAWPLARQIRFADSIVISTMKSATDVAAGGTGSSVVSAEVASILKGRLDTMKYANLKTAIALSWASALLAPEPRV
jgi:RNA polymerase sigma factor (sigma-70 family)